MERSRVDPGSIVVLITWLWLGGVLGAQPSPSPAHPAGAPPGVAPVVHAGDGWTIGLPPGWRPLPMDHPTIVLHVIGDGQTGVPMMDGTLAPIQIGISIDSFKNAAGSPREMADALTAELKGAPNIQASQEPTIDEITLTDGTPASLLTAEFERSDKNRHSLNYKLVSAKGPDQRMVVTGFISCGREAGTFIHRSGIAGFLKAHITSFVIDSKKFDMSRLAGAYASHNWRLADGIRDTRTGNDHLDRADYPAAVQAFSSALACCPHISAAHNGLAWALASPDDPAKRDAAKALDHARRAVALTARQDPSALDTLALAHFRAGDAANAVRTIKEAIALKPGYPDFERALQRYEAPVAGRTKER